MGLLGRLLRHVTQTAASIRPGKVFYVVDQANWSFYWDGIYVCQGLRRLGQPARISTDPWFLRRQLVHFGNRYVLLYGPHEALHPSNHVFLNWFHGGPEDDDPVIQEMLEKLRGLAARLDRIVVTSTIAWNALVAAGIREELLVHMPVGVDVSRFKPAAPAVRARRRAQLGIPADAICVGSFQKDGSGWGEGMAPKLSKGPDVFLEAVARLRTRHPQVFVLITGPARGYVKAGLQRLGVPYRHDYLKRYHDVIRYYHALDLYIIASRLEGGPKALLEAWATGVPLVSTRMGMPADVVRHGENGMLADVEDAEGLALAADAIIDDPALRARCRDTALAEIARYSWRRVARLYYERLYKPALAEPRWRRAEGAQS